MAVVQQARVFFGGWVGGASPQKRSKTRVLGFSSGPSLIHPGEQRRAQHRCAWESTRDSRMTLSLLHETELRRIVDKYPLVNELQPLGLRVGAGPKAVQFGFSSRHHKDLRIPRMQGVTAHDFPIPPFSRASLVLIVITIVIINSYIIYI